VEPLVTHFEDRRPSPASLPAPLREAYGGGLELEGQTLYCNFVTSLDGVASLEAPRGRGPATIAGQSEADRFVMGLLRALADCVLVGAGTLRDGGNHVWTASAAHPPSAPAYALLERREPDLVLVTGRGELDASRRALERPTLVLTTEAGRRRLEGTLPATCRVRSLGEGPLTGRTLLAAVRAEGYRRVLTEGGPALLATLVADGLVDELFMTLSPVLGGRIPGDGRLTIVEGVHLLPDHGRWGRLRSLRTHGSHLFVRYDLRTLPGPQ
jgi:riboflavin biosynthesis pyrimidine reductase